MLQEAFLTHQWCTLWSQLRTPPVGWPSPVASPPSLAAGTRPGLRAPAGPPSWLRIGRSEEKVWEVICREAQERLDPVQIDTHSPRIQLLFHRHHRKVTLACTHVLGTAASFKHVHLLGGELPSAPEVHLSWASGHHSNRGVSHCTQPTVQPRQQISYVHILQSLKWKLWKLASTTYFGFFIAKFSRATRSSSSLTEN